MVNPSIGELEGQLKRLFEEGRVEEASQIVIDKIDDAIELTGRYVPDKARAELGVKSRVLWHDFGRTVFTKRVSDRHEALRESRYGIEDGVFEPRHPKRVQRVWGEAKPVLEERYGRSFESREDFAIMNSIYRNSEGLKKERMVLEDAIIAQERMGKYGDQIVGIWRKYNLGRAAIGCAASLIGLLKDIESPEEIFEPEDDLAEIGGHTADVDPDGWGTGYSRRSLEFMTRILMDGISYREALNMVDDRLAEQAGMLLMDIRRKKDFRLPEPVQRVMYSTIRKGYENREEGDDCSKLMKWLSGIFLERWGATAVDYERAFSFHTPSVRERYLMAFYYSMKGGEPVFYNDDICQIDRLPAVLRTMVEDGIIREGDIDPPITETHLRKPEEYLLSGRKDLPEGMEVEDVFGDREEGEATIRTTMNRKLLHESGNLPIRSDTGLLPLANVLDPTSDYYVLYRGNRIVFIASEFFYPNGSQGVGEIYKLALVENPESVKEGEVVVIRGEPFLVKREDCMESRRVFEDAALDVNVDATTTKSFNVVVDISPEDFREYFRDFMAHVAINTHLGSKGKLQGLLDNIDDMDVVGTGLYLGISSRTYFHTFELGGKFGFQLLFSEDLPTSEPLSVGKSLVDHLRGMGLGVYQKVETDETGRSVVEYKLREREFQSEHIGGVIESLRGDGLVRILSHVLMDDKYSLTEFGEPREPCAHCGQIYIGGGIYRHDKGDQWINGEGIAYDMHALTKHPETFVNRGGNLRRIYDMISDASGHEVVFLSNPELMEEFSAFSKAHQAYVNASNAGFEFYLNHQGGVSLYHDPEEIEEDPELKRLDDEQKRLYETEKVAEVNYNRAAWTLQSKYEELAGIEPDGTLTDSNVTHFWSSQLTLFNLYRTVSPKLLTEFSGQKIMEDPSRYVITR
jgi:hypothetical protein